MATSGHSTGMVGYIIQTTGMHLITAYEVANVRHDLSQFVNMAIQTKTAMAKTELNVVVNRVISAPWKSLNVRSSGIISILHKPATSGAKAGDRFGKDEHCCPAAQHFIRRFCKMEGGLNLSCFWSSHCSQCPIKQNICLNNLQPSFNYFCHFSSCCILIFHEN